MVEEKHGVCVAEMQGGGPGWRQELSCSLCKQLFSSLLQLRQHEYSHTLSLMALSLDCLNHHRPLVSSSPLNPPPARYHCSQCPASFTLKSNADRHEKTIHLKRKLMQCMYCLKHFRDRTDLNRHLSSVHSSERIYTCPACSRTFSTQKNLATHGKVCYQSGIPPTEQLWNLHGLKEDDHIHIDDWFSKPATFIILDYKGNVIQTSGHPKSSHAQLLATALLTFLKKCLLYIFFKYLNRQFFFKTTAYGFWGSNAMQNKNIVCHFSCCI